MIKRYIHQLQKKYKENFTSDEMVSHYTTPNISKKVLMCRTDILTKHAAKFFVITYIGFKTNIKASHYMHLSLREILASYILPLGNDGHFCRVFVVP